MFGVLRMFSKKIASSVVLHIADFGAEIREFLCQRPSPLEVLRILGFVNVTPRTHQSTGISTNDNKRSFLAYVCSKFVNLRRIREIHTFDEIKVWTNETTLESKLLADTSVAAHHFGGNDLIPQHENIAVVALRVKRMKRFLKGLKSLFQFRKHKLFSSLNKRPFRFLYGITAGHCRAAWT